MSLVKPKYSAVATTVGIYVRVSTKEQAEGHSLAHQEDACREFAENLGIGAVKLYSDAGYSAKTANRPAFQRLLEDAEAGRIGAVVVLKLDRFARNRLDALLAKERLRKAGVKLHSVSEPLDDTPAGLITEGMLQLIAEWYSADLKMKVTSGLRKRAEKGLMNAMPPFGYRQSENPTADPPELVEDEAELILEAYERFATGAWSYRQIANDWNERGYRTRHRAPSGKPEDGPRLWSGDSVRKLIQSPIYAGKVPYKIEVLPGCHEPIVSEELWHRANRIGARLGGSSKGYRQVHTYSLAGIIRCSGCGSTLQGNSSRSGERHRYYREAATRRGVVCEKPQIAVRADRAEAMVDEVVKGFRAPPELRERVFELLRVDTPSIDPEREIGRLKERLKRLARLFADLAVTEAEYSEQRRKIEAEIARLEVPAEKARQAVAEFDVLQTAWAKATPIEKRSLGLALFERIDFDMESMEITQVVVSPAFRPWIVQGDNNA